MMSAGTIASRYEVKCFGLLHSIPWEPNEQETKTLLSVECERDEQEGNDHLQIVLQSN
jgi:hypothetical protein